MLEVGKLAQPWVTALNPSERRFLSGYLAQTEEGETFVSMLSQNPGVGNRGIVSIATEPMYTIIRQPDLHWIEAPREVGGQRPFTASELLLMLGFPVLTRLGNPVATPGGAAVSRQTRTRRHRLGTAMI